MRFKPGVMIVGGRRIYGVTTSKWIFIETGTTGIHGDQLVETHAYPICRTTCQWRQGINA